MDEPSRPHAVVQPVYSPAAAGVSAQDPPHALRNAVRPGIEVRGLRKSFGDKMVLDGVDLDVEQGTVFALLGPNGAGKTTAVRILSTLLNPDGGEVRVGGFDPARQADKVRSVIGVTGQFSAVDNLLTGNENLMLIADLHHIERRAARRKVGELLGRFDLADAAGRTAATYSGGMRRRLDLAMTLVGDPRVIFLDEPTAGLDPRSRRTMWQIVRELAGAGTTVLLTTQDLDEADQLANRIAVLDHGRIVAEGTPDELKRRIPGGHARLYFADTDALERAAELLTGSSRDNDTLTLRVPTDSTPASLTALLGTLERHAVSPERVGVQGSDLDDVFLALTANPQQETLK
ncbi:MAG: ATP-binding cassette domain-containing protein [Acidimicrobiales bacterium]|jgi:ABC-2 type transport system ATP-binding protein